MIVKDKLKIQIVENQKEIFPILVRDIGENFKSGDDVALIRFDAYADFLAPKDLSADEIERLDHLTTSIDNQCWILPAVYRGYITMIFWFKPPWAHEFHDGVYQLQIGKCQQTGVLKVASTIPYFTSNCVYSSGDKLSNIRTVDVYVSTSGLAKNYSTTIENPQLIIYNNDSGSESLDSDNRKKAKLSDTETNHKDSSSSTGRRIHSLDATLVNQLLENKQFLIDINLSFFSTDDPVRKQFDENEYEVLRYIYTRIVQDTSDVEILQYITARESALEQIRTFMNEYLTGPKVDQPIVIDNIYLSALIAVIRYKKLDWKLVHQYGMRLSDTRPPLHVSSEGMILYLLEAIAKVLESIKKSPILITLSRCVDDGYCSLEQADLIQLYAEKKLRKLYQIDEILGKSLSKTLDNEDEDESEMNDEEPINLKSQPRSVDENTHRSTIDTTNTEEESAGNESAAPKKTSPEMSTTSPTDLTIQTSPKSSLSPGEIKPVSPSSLSETSAVSN